MEAAFSGQNQHQNQKPFTTEGTENTERGKPGQVVGEEQERISRRARALVRRIGEACDELERLAEENPELVGRVTHGAEDHKDAYLRLKARLAMADEAPRCRWVRQDGTTCGSPQMKRHIYCFAHRQMAEAQALMLRLPALEDANAIQVGLMRIQKALIEGTISTKTAGLLLYSMQLALQNVGRTTFGQVKAQELVRETIDQEAAFSDQRSEFSENQRPFTTVGAEEEKNLPLMNTDDTDQKRESMAMNRSRPVEWRPSAEMFRMDTPEGMEAYEASARMKIARRMGGERRPEPAMSAESKTAQPGAAVPQELGRPHEHAEPRINQG